MPLLTYTVSDFQPFTKILSADVNSRFQDIKTLLNTTGLDSTNVQQYGLSRDRLAAGTASHVLINDGSGHASSEAQLATTRGGTGFSPTVSVANAGKVIGVNDAGNALELRTAMADRLTMASNADISTLTAGEAISARDAVCLALGKDGSNNDIYRVFKCDADLGSRNRNFIGFATGTATVTAHIQTWTDSAALVSSNVITWKINNRSYTQSFTVDNDTTLAAIAVQIAADPEVQSAAVTDAGSNDRVITITGKGGLQINVTSATVTGGASQATITMNTTQSSSGDAVSIRYFGAVAGFSSLTPGALYYLSGTAGGITTTPTVTSATFVGQAISDSVLMMSFSFGGFLFATNASWVSSHGQTGAGPTNGTQTAEQFNFSSWTTAANSGTAASHGQHGEAFYQTNHVFVDGMNTSSVKTLYHNTFNKTAWASATNRSTARAMGGIGVLSNVMYVGKGVGGAVSSAVDSWNGSSWTAGAATLTTAHQNPGCIVQGGIIRWIGGTAGSGTTEHATYNGSAASLDTVFPATNVATTSARSGTVGSSGILGGLASNSAASYKWNGSWGASLTMTAATNGAAALANDGAGGGSAYNTGTSMMYSNGGINVGNAGINTTQKFNDTSWASDTSSALSKGAQMGGVF